MFGFLKRNRHTNQTEAAELPSRQITSSVKSIFREPIDLTSIEEKLIAADFGVETAEKLVAEVSTRAKKLGATGDSELRLLLRDLLTEKLTRSDSKLNLTSESLPHVVLVVGVNGAGKTTTIGKLAKWLTDGQWQVVIGAADTFRAAAVEQLATWVSKAGATLITPDVPGQDPAAVAYRAVEQAINSKADIVIIDTAGRLQNKQDLMDELGKIRRAIEKQTPVSEVLLVLDATMGQNAISQARAFAEVANVTGIVLTKLDGSAKGGIAYSVQEQLDIPVKLIGVGEKDSDFAFFSPKDFAASLLAK